MQSFLNGLRTQAGMGAGVASPPYMRSAAQNNTQSGNPGYASNMTGYGSMAPQQAPPMTWQQQMQQTMQQRSALAQDPTAIQYMVPQPASGQPQGWGGQASQMAARNAGMTPLQYAQQQPGADPNAINAALMQQQGMPNVNSPQGFAGMNPQMMGGMFNMPQLANMQGGPRGQPSLFVQPRPVAPALGGAPGQPNLTAGYGGGAGNSRFVRPMQR